MGETQGRGRNDKGENSCPFCPTCKAKPPNYKVSELENSQHNFFVHIKLTDSKPNMEIFQGADMHFFLLSFSEIWPGSCERRKKIERKKKQDIFK